METEVLKDKNSILADLVKRAEVLAAKVRELESAKVELDQINKAIEALGGRGVNSMNIVSKAIIDSIVGAYQVGLSWPEKIKYVVSRLGHATVQDIIAELKKVEPALAKDPTKLHNNVTSVSSSLAAKGELTAYKDGIKNVYAIPKK